MSFHLSSFTYFYPSQQDFLVHLSFFFYRHVLFFLHPCICVHTNRISSFVRSFSSLWCCYVSGLYSSEQKKTICVCVCVFFYILKSVVPCSSSNIYLYFLAFLPDLLSLWADTYISIHICILDLCCSSSSSDYYYELY